MGDHHCGDGFPIQRLLQAQHRMIVPDKDRDPGSFYCWRATAIQRRIAPFSHDLLLSSAHRTCQRESESFSIPPGVKSSQRLQLSSATRSIYIQPQFALNVVISFLQMSLVLRLSNTPRLVRFTGLCAGAMVATYISLEAPYSGMSMNPACTFASALPA